MRKTTKNAIIDELDYDLDQIMGGADFGTDEI